MFEIIEAKIDYRIKELVILEEALTDDGNYYCVISIPLGEQIPDRFSKEGLERFMMEHDTEGFASSGLTYEEGMKEFNS